MTTPNYDANQATSTASYPPKLRHELKAELRAAGCFAPAPRQLVLHMFAVVIIYAAAFALLLTQPETSAWLAALVLLAFSSVQAGYIAHEAGHGAITRQRWLAVTIGQFFNTFLTALCYAHFQKIHICHHSHCNDQDRDIDMQSAFFSLYPDARNKNRSLPGRFIGRYQAWLIWPLVSFQGFALKIDSLKTLYRNRRQTRADQFVLILHLLLWFGLPVKVLGFEQAALNYFLMTWMIGPYLGSVFLVNHIGTHVVHADDRLPGFLQRLMSTRNLGASHAADIFFGGMNNHIEHHLFPSIASARLRQARPIVQAFCQRHGLPYRQTKWRYALREVFVYLQLIAQQPLRSTAASPAQVQSES
jgi:fatty acid desaturase